MPSAGAHTMPAMVLEFEESVSLFPLQAGV